MKTKFYLLICILLMYTSSFGQAFKKGKSYGSIGYSYQVLNIKTLFNVSQITGTHVTGFGPATVKFEYAVSDKVGVGVSMAYSAAGLSWSSTSNGGAVYNYKYNWSKLTITPRFNFHFGDDKHFDPYFGIGLGIKRSNLTFTSNDPNYLPESGKGLPVSMETVFGGRYLFSENFGAFAEIGIGHGFITGGIVAKF